MYYYYYPANGRWKNAVINDRVLLPSVNCLYKKVSSHRRGIFLEMRKGVIIDSDGEFTAGWHPSLFAFCAAFVKGSAF